MAATAALTGCDVPPDVHLFVSADSLSDGEYVVWRMHGRYRRRPRMVQSARYRTGAAARFSIEDEIPTGFRVTPLGPLPRHERVTLRIDRYQPGYRSNAPTHSALVLARFEPGRHLRLDVHLRRYALGWGGLPGAPGGTAAPITCELLVGPGCHLASDEERAGMAAELAASSAPAAGEAPPTRDDVDEDDEWTGPAGFSEPPALPECTFVCDMLRDLSTDAPAWPPPPPMPPDSGRLDAGADAADPPRPDARAFDDAAAGDADGDAADAREGGTPP